MDDPLARAEIEILAMDHDLEVVGLEGNEVVVLEEGQGMKLPADAPPRPTPVIVKPPPLPGGGIRAFRFTTEELAPIPAAELDSLKKGEPIVCSVSFSQTGVDRLDLRQLRAIAGQAADLDRRLVIVAVDAPDE
jgi:hypothetical protein